LHEISTFLQVKNDVCGQPFRRELSQKAIQ
jgi:hypothetical protein